MLAASTPSHHSAFLLAYGLDANLTTDQAAAALNRRPQTLRKWASQESGPIRPIRIHGRLAWPVKQIASLLNVEG